MSDVTITIPDALLAAYQQARIMRTARDPARPLPAPSRELLEQQVIVHLRSLVAFEYLQETPVNRPEAIKWL